MQSGVQRSRSHSPHSDYYAWEFPGAPARVHLHLGVVEELERQLLWLYQYDPESLLFGVLLGRVNPNGAIIVDEFERVEDAGDAERLKIVLARWAAKADPKLSVVGFYRSHNREGFALSNDDLALLRDHFREPLSVAMLIKPSAAAAATAGFFFGRNGEAKSMFSFGRFPFDRRQLEVTNKETQRKAPHEPVQPIPLPVPGLTIAPPEEKSLQESIVEDTGVAVPEPPSTPAEPERPEPGLVDLMDETRPAESMWLAVVAALALLALGVQLFQWFGLSPVEAVALTARRTEQGLEVHWNRNARLFNGDGALMHIQEGAFQKDVYLDLPKIRTGRIVYHPHSNSEIQLRMEVFLRGGQHSATVETAVAAEPAPVVAPVSRAQENPDESASPELASPAPAASRAGAGSAVVVMEPPDPTVVMNLPGSVQQVAVASGNQAVDLPSSTGTNGSVELPNANSQTPDTSVVKLDAGNVMVEPRVVHSVMPQMPTPNKAWRGEPMLIDVLVQIDTEGAVIAAVARNSKTPAGIFLGKIATDAAQQWKFEPAYVSGKKMASEMLLRFQF